MYILWTVLLNKVSVVSNLWFVENNIIILYNVVRIPKKLN